MKRIFSVLLAMILLLTVHSFAEIDLSGMTDEELLNIINAAELQLALREETIVQEAVGLLKDFWTEEYKEDFYENTDGYLEIIYTRVIYLNDAETADDVNAQWLKKHFPDVYAIVEFIFLTDYYESAPYYWESGKLSRGNNVIVYRDGTMEICADLLNITRGKTYSSDFSGIIKSISNLGDKYNGIYHLIEWEE